MLKMVLGNRRASGVKPATPSLGHPNCLQVLEAEFSLQASKKWIPSTNLVLWYCCPMEKMCVGSIQILCNFWGLNFHDKQVEVDYQLRCLKLF